MGNERTSTRTSLRRSFSWSCRFSGERADRTVSLLLATTGKAPATTVAGTATLRAGGESNAAKRSAPELGVTWGVRESGGCLTERKDTHRRRTATGPVTQPAPPPTGSPAQPWGHGAL